PATEPARVAERPVQLHELAEAAKTTIRVASTESRTTARISLEPQELGRVEINLRYDGGNRVAATVTADSQSAPNVLTAPPGDLRRTLEAQGFTVVGLDAAQGGLDPGANADRERLADQNGRPASGGFHAEDDTAESTTIEATSLPLDGSQVDVLA